MKKIVAVSVIRNENDIIESFCRYIASYCDLLLIQDDDSTDNTKAIVYKLIVEGLPILFVQDVIPSESREFRSPQAETLSALMDIAFNTYDADVVIPADADEFLVSDEGASPRMVLDHLQDDKGYRIRWRTYIYNSNEMKNDVFLPELFLWRRKPELEHYWKVVVTRQLYMSYRCSITEGSHNLKYPNKQNSAPMEDITNLYVAHFPIRSVPQLTAKVVNGWYSYLARPNRGKRWGYHWEKIYQEIKKTGGLSESSARDASIRYSIKEEIELSENAFLSVYDPMRTDFTNGQISLKYTDYSLIQAPYWGNILENTEQLIMFLVQKQSDLVKLSEIAEREIASMKSSRSWRITKPLRIVGRVLRKYKPE